ALDTNPTGSVTGFSAGSGFTLLSADVQLGASAQYAVQGTAGTINPSVTVTGGADSFNAVALALKPAAAGTAPAPGIRIVHVYHVFYTRQVALQFPSTGNLLVGVSAFSPATGVTLTAMSSNPGNTWVKAPGVPQSNAPQIWYAANAVTGPTLRVTPTQSPMFGVSLVFYDITGAATSPYDSAAGLPLVDKDNNNNSNLLHMPDITPSTPNGLILVVMPNGYGPPTGMVGAGFTLDTITYGGEIDRDNMDNADGYAHYYNSTATLVSFGWVMHSSQLPEDSLA